MPYHIRRCWSSTRGERWEGARLLEHCVSPVFQDVLSSLGLEKYKAVAYVYSRSFSESMRRSIVLVWIMDNRG